MAKRISELDIATSVSDSDFIPCVQGGVTKRATRAALYPDDVPVDTTSRIFDLTGDRVPPIPDDPAGVTYFNNNFTTADGWTANNCTLSYSGGKMIITSTNAAFSISRTVTASRLVIMKIRKVSSAGTSSKIANSTGTDYSNIKLYGNNIEHIHAAYIGSGATGVLVLTPATAGSGVAIGDVFEISEIYIGTGAYLSKTVDRAGVPWTNFGALPVDGPFGKGLRFNGAQYLQAPGPMIGTTGTLAFFIKRGSIGTDQYLFDSFSINKGFGVRFTTGNVIRISYGDGTTAVGAGAYTLSDTLTNHFIVITYSATEIKIWVDGILVETIAKTVSVVPVDGSANVGKVYGASTTAYFTGTIYAIRADSRVWTDEEIARWSRDPYSEDSGLIDAFSLSFARLPTFADNAAAIAGNLPVGKLYKTSTGNVLVRY